MPALPLFGNFSMTSKYLLHTSVRLTNFTPLVCTSGMFRFNFIIVTQFQQTLLFRPSTIELSLAARSVCPPHLRFRSLWHIRTNAMTACFHCRGLYRYPKYLHFRTKTFSVKFPTLLTSPLLWLLSDHVYPDFTISMSVIMTHLLDYLSILLKWSYFVVNFLPMLPQVNHELSVSYRQLFSLHFHAFHQFPLNMAWVWLTITSLKNVSTDSIQFNHHPSKNVQ